MTQRASLRLTLYGHLTQGCEAVRLSFFYPRVDVHRVDDLPVLALQLSAFLAGG